MTHPYSVVGDDLHVARAGLEELGGEAVGNCRADRIEGAQRRREGLIVQGCVRLVAGEVEARGEMALDCGGPATREEYSWGSHIRCTLQAAISADCLEALQ